MLNKLSILKLRLIAVVTIATFSAQVKATNGDIRVGLNAIQTGMANAVVAKPESTATIFTNPAGFGTLDMENMRFDIGFALMHPPRSTNGVDSDSNLFFMPTGSFAFHKTSNVTVGAGFSALAGFGMDTPDAFPGAPGNQQFVTTKELIKFAPGVSVKVNDELSIGGSLDIYNQGLALSTPGFTLPQNRQFGFGATIGAIYKPSDNIQFGLSYNSEGDMSAHEFNTADGKITIDLDHPAILTLGAAYTTDSGLVIEGDIKEIYFSKVRDKVNVGRPAGYSGPIPATLNFGWDDQTVIALGVRKDVSEKLTLRGGVNYGKSPISESDVNNNLGAAAIVETHLAIGLTYRHNKHISHNISYTRALENEVTSSVAPNNTLKMHQDVLTFNIAITY